MATLLFYLMASGALVAALVVVLAKNPITSVLALLGSFFCLATIYLLAGFQLLAAAQILVYAGAIMVLFLFVIMLLNLGHLQPTEAIDLALFKRRRVGLAVAVATLLLLAGTAATLTGPRSPAPARPQPERGIDDPQAMAGAMFSRYLLPFEATSLLLLATAVAVLVLAKRDRTTRAQRAALAAATPEARPAGAPPAPAERARRRDEEPTGARS